MYKKTDEYLLLQSPSLAYINKIYSNLLFCDETFYIARAICYQLFIIRVYAKDLNRFFTTAYALMNNKEQKNYENIFSAIKSNINNTNNLGEFKPKELHCDFEIAISNAFKKIFPQSKIKFCYWHLVRSLDNNKKKYCYNEVQENEDIKISYKCICNLAFIDPDYVEDIFSKIRDEYKIDNIDVDSEEFIEKKILINF